MNKFQVGDIVSAFGLVGTVVNIGCTDYPVKVKWEDGPDSYDDFTESGKLLSKHVLGSLQLIRRPAPKTLDQAENLLTKALIYLDYETALKKQIEQFLALK